MYDLIHCSMNTTFLSEYPLTAKYFYVFIVWCIVTKDLIQGTTLTVALNFIWESCNQPQDSHFVQIYCASFVLNFKSRLYEYPILL